jgi:hypothetical protein
VLNIRLVQEYNPNEEIYEKVDDPDTTLYEPGGVCTLENMSGLI